MRDIRIVERDGKLWFECDDSYYDCEVRGEDVALVLSHSWGGGHSQAGEASLPDLLTEVVVCRDRDALGTFITRATLEAWEKTVRAALSRPHRET